MSWPTDDLVQTNTDEGTDKPKLARANLNTLIARVKEIIAARGAVDGVASLDGTGKVPDAELPASALAVPWQTGNVRMLLGATPEAGWVLWTLGTIGSGTSGATNRANADTEALYTQLWDTYSNTVCPVQDSAGTPATRGASAAADFAADKRLQLPPGPGRVIGVAGSGSGLTTRVNGATVGEESHQLTLAESPVHAHGAGTLTAAAVGDHQHAAPSATASDGSVGTEGSTPVVTPSSLTGAAGGHGHGISGATANAGSGTPHNVMQPTFFCNFEIRL